MAELTVSQQKAVRIKILKKFSNRGIKVTTNAIEIIINTTGHDPLTLTDKIISDINLLPSRAKVLDASDIQLIANEAKQLANPPIEQIISVATIDTMPKLVHSSHPGTMKITYEKNSSLITDQSQIESLEKKLAFVKTEFEKFSKNTMTVNGEAIPVNIIRPASILSCDTDALIGCVGALFFYDDEYYLEDVDNRVKLDLSGIMKDKLYPSCFIISGSIVVCYGTYSLTSELMIVDSITTVSIPNSNIKFLESSNISISDECIPLPFNTWNSTNNACYIPAKLSQKLIQLAKEEAYSMTFINNFNMTDSFQINYLIKILKIYKQSNLPPSLIVMTGNFANSPSQSEAIKAANNLYEAMKPYKDILSSTQLLLIPGSNDLTTSPSSLMPRGPLLSSPWKCLNEIFDTRLILGSSPSVIRICDKFIYVARHQFFNTFRKLSILPPKSSTFDVLASTMESNMSIYPLTDPSLVLLSKAHLLNFWQKPDLIVVADDLDFASYNESFVSLGNFSQGSFTIINLNENEFESRSHSLSEI